MNKYLENNGYIVFGHNPFGWLPCRKNSICICLSRECGINIAMTAIRCLEATAIGAVMQNDVPPAVGNS